MRKAGMKHRGWYNATFFYLILIIVILAAGLTFYGLGSTSQISHRPVALYSGALYNSAVLQYDQNIYHTYSLEGNVSNFSIILGGAEISTPTIYDGSFFVSTMGNLTILQEGRYNIVNGTVERISATNGSIEWSDTFPDQMMTQPIVISNEIVVGMGNNAEVKPQNLNMNDGIFALNATDGKVIWNITTIGPVMTTPAVYNGVLIAPATSVIYFINYTTGNVLKTLRINIPDTLSSPLLVGHTAFFGAGESSYGPYSPDYWFYSVNMLNESFAWKDNFSIAGGGINDVSPSFWEGTVITGYLRDSNYTNQTIIGINATTGKEIWGLNEIAAAENISVIDANSSLSYVYRSNFTENTMSPITVWNGTGFANSNFFGELFAFNTTTGQVKWIFNTGPCEASPNVVEGRYLAIVSDPGVLYIINMNNGTLVKAIDTGMPHLSSEPIAVNNGIIFGTMTGRLVGLNLTSILSGGK
jgi:outer membrane protein assembly factor BamB